MTKISATIVLVCTLFALGLQAQPARRTGYLYDKVSGQYRKVDRSMVISTSLTSSTEKTVTALNKVWVLPTTTAQGHWRRARAGEIEARNKQRATHLYGVSISHYPSYPPQTAGAKKLNLDNINEETKLLSKAEVDNEGLSGLNGRMNVHYMNKINLGMVALTREQDHIIVADSVYISAARKLGNSFVCIDQAGRPFLKLIANTIVYESPIQLSLMGKESGDFVFSADQIFFKSTYQGLQPHEISPAPPIVIVADDLQNNIYKNHLGSTERTLLNRLYIKLMEQSFSSLATTEDEWIRDKLIERFQMYRFRRVKPELMSSDPVYQGMMTQVIGRFEEAFRDFQLKRLRDLDGTAVIVDGNIDQLQAKPLKYYALPTIANLKPLLRDSALGTILYTGTGDADISVVLETELGYDENAYTAASAKLASRGLVLEKKLAQNIVSIDAQPLKTNGRTMGKIVPVGSSMLRLELDLKEGAKTIAEIFPRSGGVVFHVDVQPGPGLPAITMPLLLRADTTLLAKMDYTAPLKSFQVIERTALTGSLKISSNVSASRVQEGALNYLEVLLDISSGDRSALYGPYRLSAYNTLASEIIVPFLKYSSDQRITISGRAVYDDGEVNIKPFETSAGVIVLDDAMLGMP